MKKPTPKKSQKPQPEQSASDAAKTSLKQSSKAAVAANAEAKTISALRREQLNLSNRMLQIEQSLERLGEKLIPIADAIEQAQKSQSQNPSPAKASVEPPTAKEAYRPNPQGFSRPLPAVPQEGESDNLIAGLPPGLVKRGMDIVENFLSPKSEEADPMFEAHRKAYEHSLNAFVAERERYYQIGAWVVDQIGKGKLKVDMNSPAEGEET